MPNEGITKDENKTEHPHPAPPPSEGEGEGGGWFICVLNFLKQDSRSLGFKGSSNMITNLKRKLRFYNRNN